MEKPEADCYSFRKLCEQIHLAFAGDSTLQGKLRLVELELHSPLPVKQESPASNKKFRGRLVY